MNNLKRLLALVLVMSMLLTVAPISAFATESTDPTGETTGPAADAPESTDPTGEAAERAAEDGVAVAAAYATAPTTNLTTTGSPFQKGTGGSNSFRIPALVTLSDGTLVAAADARWNTTYDGGGLDTMVAISKDNGATWTHSFANYLGDNGNEYNGSSSTCFIDPSLAVTRDDTIYMLVDLYPYGIALNGNVAAYPNTDTGFTEGGYLKLDYNSAGTYGYYLKDGKIYANGAANPLNGYTVDAYFNVTNENVSPATTSNLFFADSIFKVARTGFLYLTKSTNGGETWSAPTLLPLKNGSEQVCLVGPGRGLVTSKGVIIFPVYSYAGESSKYTGLIYSDDNGTTWNRTATFSQIISSEATMLELDNGDIRVFLRNDLSKLVYADYKLGTNGMSDGWWGTYVNTGVACNSDTELSAITYSYGVVDDGVEKNVVFVSAPGGPSSLNGTNDNNGAYRSSGKIFMGLIDPEDYTMTWKSNSLAVTPVAANAFSGSTYTAEQGFFGYSCLTQKYESGDIAILYEDSQQGWGTGDGFGYTMNFKTYTQKELATAFGVTFTGDTDVEVDGPDSTVEPVTLKVGETVNKTIKGVTLNGEKEDTYAKVTWVGTEGTAATGVHRIDSAKVDLADCLFTFTDHETEGFYVVESSAFAGRYLNNTMGDSSANDPISATPGKISVTLNHTDMFRLQNNNVDGSTYGSPYYAGLHFHTELADPYWNRCGTDTSEKCCEYLYRVAEAGEESSTEIPGYIRLKSLNEIKSGGKYLIAHTNGTNYYVLYPGTTGDKWDYVVKVDSDSTVSEPSTAVTITGKAVGETSVQVGSTTYNITVTRDFKNEVNVELDVGESQTFNDETGNYENDANNVAPNAAIATMKVEGTTTEGTTEEVLTLVNSITSGNRYYLSDGKGNFLSLNGNSLTNKTNIAEATLWTVTASGQGYRISSGNRYLRISNGSLTTGTSSSTLYYVSNTGFCRYSNGSSPIVYNNGWSLGTLSNDNGAKAYTLTEQTTAPVEVTDITFTGVSAGKTVAYVGMTKYNITVSPAGVDAVVDIELEVGEDFTYTDTTGNHTDNVTQEPDSTKATMTLTSTPNATREKLVDVTAKTFETGKLYVIENVRTADPNHDAYQPDDSVLTATEVVGGATGLDMNGPLDVATSQKWSFTPSDNMYFVKANGEYIHIDAGNATMETTAQSLSFEYVDGSGWLIYYNADGNNTSNDGDYFLSDLYGTGSGEAFGYTTKNDDGNYWNIYEVVEETTTEATKVTFHGVAAGTTTTAIVGNTQYNITVVPQEADDEVENTATGIWTVDPEIQRNEYNEIVAGKHKDLYTDDSWKQYETARQAAYKALTEVSHATYTSEAEAKAALDILEDLVEDLKTAEGNLVSAKTISVRYHLNTVDGTLLDTREYKITATETSVALPDTIVVNNIAYKVSDTTLEILGEETAYDVVVTEIGKQGGGFVGSQDIDLGKDHNNHDTVCDLVDNQNVGKKITEMTLTTGISYDLDLATEMKDGYTVEWTVENTNTIVATVDADGRVTAVAPGTTNVTATVKDASGNIVEVNSMPVTVHPKGSADRYTAIYIEEVNNTTVWCVVNGDTQNYGFECIEGELIYGQFDTTVSDGTKTTAMSFFGDPDEAHALVYMKSTNSDDHYFLLHDDEGNLYDGTKKANANYYVSGQTSGAGYWQAVGLSGNQTGTNTPGWSIIKDMVQWAINQGCDGGLGFTRRQNEGPLGSNLRFKSDPMPRIEKVVDGVLPTSRKQADYRRYVEGMVAAVNELVYFKMTVTQEVPSEWKKDTGETIGAITYSSAMVTDTVLPGAYLYTKALDQADGSYDGEIAAAYRVQEDEITDELNAAWTAEQKAAGKRTFDYYLVYEIQESDIPKFWIDNIANLSYKYQSHYSTGAQAAAADAEARISVVGSAIDSVVIDFGQSFVYKGHEYTSITDGKTYTFKGLTNVHLKGAFVEGKNDEGIDRTTSYATAKYGTVKVYREAMLNADGTVKKDDKGYTEYTYTVTYTPNRILLGVDTVLIYGYGDNNQEKIINGFMVYPATTVYYEEGFMLDGNDGWNTEKAEGATVEQTFELLGASQFNEHGELTHKVSNKKHAYGYDPIYDDGKAADKSSYISATDVGQSTAFTFTGTGFELYANSKISTGKVSAKVVNSDGKVVKMYIVNTVASIGDSDVTAGQNTDLDSLPIVAVKNLEHDTYTVTLSKVVADSGPVYIDGVRIVNTMEDSTLFTIDQEDNPEFHHLRDYVLNAVNINEDTSVDYPTMYDQVYAMLDADASAFIVSADEYPYGEENTAQDLLDNGPKNEVYLHENEALVFNVKTSRVMQLGLKAPQGTASYAITGATNGGISGTLNTSVDMFYELGNAIGTETEYTITVENTGSTILSVTDLKICDDPNAAFVALTQENVENALVNMGYGDPCTTGHSYDAVVTEPTCTEAGYTTYTCHCGDTYVGDETEALGHSHKAVVTEPTCTKAGYTTYTCRCGDTYVGDEAEALGHSHKAVVTDPTCTKAGYTTYTCRCGDTYVADETEALGHSHKAVVTDPTCTKAGYTTYTCHCGDTFVDDYVDATGHDYSNGRCNDCGAKAPNAGSSGTVGQIISQILRWIFGRFKR